MRVVSRNDLYPSEEDVSTLNPARYLLRSTAIPAKGKGKGQACKVIRTGYSASDLIERDRARQ